MVVVAVVVVVAVAVGVVVGVVVAVAVAVVVVVAVAVVVGLPLSEQLGSSRLRGGRASRKGTGGCLTDDEYRQVQDSIALVSSVVEGLPLDEFVDIAGRSLAMGPYADPTLYRKAGPKLELLMETAVHLLEIKKLNAKARKNGVIR